MTQTERSFSTRNGWNLSLGLGADQGRVLRHAPLFWRRCS